jgi:hypothetical protein
VPNWGGCLPPRGLPDIRHALVLETRSSRPGRRGVDPRLEDLVLAALAPSPGRYLRSSISSESDAGWQPLTSQWYIVAVASAWPFLNGACCAVTCT